MRAGATVWAEADERGGGAKDGQVVIGGRPV